MSIAFHSTLPEDVFFKLAYDFTNATADMLANGAVTAKHYDIRGPAGKKDLFLDRVTVAIEDASQTYGTFGGLGALSNGVGIALVNPQGETVKDLLDGEPITRNGDWQILAGVDATLHAAGANITWFTVRWSLFHALNGPLRLPTNWNLRFTINDDVSAMDLFRIKGQGFLG